MCLLSPCLCQQWCSEPGDLTSLRSHSVDHIYVDKLARLTVIWICVFENRETAMLSTFMTIIWFHDWLFTIIAGPSLHHLGVFRQLELQRLCDFWHPRNLYLKQGHQQAITLKHVLLFWNTKPNVLKIPNKERFKRMRNSFSILL